MSQVKKNLAGLVFMSAWNELRPVHDLKSWPQYKKKGRKEEEAFFSLRMGGRKEEEDPSPFSSSSSYLTFCQVPYQF